MTNLKQLKADFGKVVAAYLNGGQIEVSFDKTNLTTTINGQVFTAEDQFKLVELYKGDEGFKRIMAAVNATPAAKEAQKAISSVKNFSKILAADIAASEEVNFKKEVAQEEGYKLATPEDMAWLAQALGGDKEDTKPDLFSSDGVNFLAALFGVHPSQITVVNGDGDLLSRVANISGGPITQDPFVGPVDGEIGGTHYEGMPEHEIVVDPADLDGDVLADRELYVRLVNALPREGVVRTIFDTKEQEFYHMVDIDINEEAEPEKAAQYKGLCEMYDQVLETVLDVLPPNMDAIYDTMLDATLDIISNLATDVVEKDQELDDAQIMNLVLGSLFKATANNKAK